MKAIRLLPVVICATLALLVLKGVGIATNGGYVLAGVAVAQAAGADTHGGGGGAAVGADAPAGQDPTLTDSSPTLGDTAPTLPLGAKGSAEDAHAAETAGAEGEHGAAPEPVEEAEPNVTPEGDSLPVIQDDSGEVQLLRDRSDGAEEAVLGRLGDRREELDARESELEMRMALVEAAEKRLSERTIALQALEARIEALVEEKKAADNEQFASIVAMYETMKPKDAALIFDQLEMPILLRVASAISPRKMAPIMAKMAPIKAKDLTASMAIEQAAMPLDLTLDDAGGLPQIVGQ